MRALMIAALLAVSSLTGGVAQAQAVEVANVKYEQAQDVGGHKLQLNGAGIRYKFIVKVYTAGLYLQSHASTTAEVLAMGGPSASISRCCATSTATYWASCSPRAWRPTPRATSS